MVEFDFNKIEISDEPIFGSSLAVMEYLGEKYDVKFREDPDGTIIISEGRLDTFKENLINLVSENFGLIRSLNAVFRIKPLMYSNNFNGAPVNPNAAAVPINRELLGNNAGDIKGLVKFAIFLHEKCGYTPVTLTHENSNSLIYKRFNNKEYFPWYVNVIRYTADVLRESGYSLDSEHICIRNCYEYCLNTVAYNIERIRKHIPDFLSDITI